MLEVGLVILLLFYIIHEGLIFLLVEMQLCWLSFNYT